MIAPIVYLNGEFLSHENAKISVFDRGFLFGDGVYEVIPVYAGKLFCIDKYLIRLKHSLDSTYFKGYVDLVKLKKALCELLKNNEVTCGDYLVYVQITRGASFDRNFYFDPHLESTIFAILQPIKNPSYNELCCGKKAITLQDTRWRYCHIKATSLLPSVLLYNQVRSTGCDEGILIRDSYAIEGISSNIFIVNKNIIITPPLSEENLSGITRDVVLQLLKQSKIPISIKKIPVKSLYNADEIWITSSTRGIFPVIKLDEKMIGNGMPGVMWERVVKRYLEYRKTFGINNTLRGNK